jgi:DNA-binding Xre family transcriptional regulator
MVYYQITLTQGYIMNLSKSLKIALAMRGFTQKNLGELSGLGAATLGYMSKFGQCSTTTLEAICKVLEMKVSEFIALGEKK